MDEKLISVVKSAIINQSSLLNKLSQEIWKNPELKFEEHQAHDVLAKMLKEQGFVVQEHYVLPTAFRAEYCSKNYIVDKSPCIAVLCEYDALPEVGHACGHNLIAESGFAAGLGIKAALESDPTLCGRVVVLGTPAEEGGGGKTFLIEAGAFKDIDVALMAHPAPDDILFPPFIAIDRFTVTYYGKEAHASGYPWEGINALDAAVACYNYIAMLRQHIKPTCRIHAIISKGGVAPNVIPGLSEMRFYYRAATTRDMEELKGRLESCINSAAEATGCKVKIVFDPDGQYKSLIHNKVLTKLYKKYATGLGIQFQDENPAVIPFMASSDMGNVSHVVPSIHPTFDIGTKAVNHSVGFTDASGAEAAQKPTIIASQSIALLAVELLVNPKLIDEAKASFLSDLVADSAF